MYEAGDATYNKNRFSGNNLFACVNFKRNRWHMYKLGQVLSQKEVQVDNQSEMDGSHRTVDREIRGRERREILK